jgi:hypothetical protein
VNTIQIPFLLSKFISFVLCFKKSFDVACTNSEDPSLLTLEIATPHRPNAFMTTDISNCHTEIGMVDNFDLVIFDW